MRIVLAVWVLLHHLTGAGMLLEPWAHGLPAIVYQLIREGYLAVSVFFVLSGFVLTLSYGGTDWTSRNLIRYVRGRFARIYPVYSLSLVLTLPYMLLSTAPHKSTLIANYVFLFQGWTGDLPVHWNTPAWSLSCEIFFYLCFPAAVLASRQLSLRVSLACAGAICFLPAVLWKLGTPSTFKPLIHLADFLIGILAVRGYQALRPRWAQRGYWLYIPGMAAIVALMLYPPLVPGVLDLTGFLRPFTTVTLVGLALAGGLPARALSSRAAVYLGKTSYSIYILHIPLLWSYTRWAPYWFHGVSKSGLAVIYIACVGVISALVHSFLEEPANGYLRAPATPRATVPAPPSVLLARKASEIRAVPDLDSVRSSTCVPTS